jgi:hypothetical protein
LTGASLPPVTGKRRRRDAETQRKALRRKVAD